VDYQGALHAELSEGGGHKVDYVGGVNADQLDCAPAGLVNGPRRLKAVRVPICLRAAMACRVAE